MSIQVIPKERQARGAFNGGEIVENKPIGFPREGGFIKPYSNLFYWAYAEAKVDSTIGLHPHQGFEIMSFVLKGQIRHFDTQLKEWRPLDAGDAQIIRAGNGISHAEFMGEGSAMFQIWFDPNLAKTMEQPASYSDYKTDVFPVKEENGVTVKTYIGEGSPFKLDTQGVKIERLSFEKADYSQALSADKVYSLYVLNGAFTINGEQAKQDDFIIVKETNKLDIQSEGSGQLFVIESPAELTYPTYAAMMQERMKA